MCEIFFVVKPKGTLTTNELRKFLRACVPAIEYNPDGWGAMWESGFVKGPERFKPSKIEYIVSRYRKSKFFAFHLRKATSPINYRNTHPFTISDNGKSFRGIHNGVLNVQGYNEGVDSLELFHKIRDAKGLTMRAKILEALSEGVSGTYSILIHSFREQKLYYFRNRPEFGFMLANNLIYGATRIERLECLAELSYGIFPNMKLATPQSEHVYEIDLNNVGFRVGGVITEKPRPNISNVYYFDDETQESKPIGKAIDYNNLAPRRGWGKYKYDSDKY